MLIPILPSGGGASPATWAMVELQGELERKTDSNDAFDMGTLSFTQKGSVMLHIGYHQLEGKREILKKPLAVLAKSNSEGEDTVYQLVGVIKEKYHFKSRPKPLISKPVTKS